MLPRREITPDFLVPALPAQDFGIVVPAGQMSQHEALALGVSSKRGLDLVLFRESMFERIPEAGRFGFDSVRLKNAINALWV
jgi:hypothetical protein